MTVAEVSPSNNLVVGFMGVEHSVSVDNQFTFGRQGDLIVDPSNPYLHRQLGRFWNSDGMWMLQNTGTSIGMTMTDAATTSRLTVAPGGTVAIPFEDSRLSFDVQGAVYEIDIDTPFGSVEHTMEKSTTGAVTVMVGEVSLTDTQRQCIVALAETQLSRPSSARLGVATNKNASARLGWSTSKFNRKLDNVCEKLTKAGVKGLRGEASNAASSRRERLVDHAITTGLITTDDLTVLP